MVRDIRFYKADKLPTRPVKDAVIAVLNNTQDNFSLYITDINGVPVPLYSMSGGGTIQTITNNDGSITITGTDEDKVITISSAMQSLINGALQNGDNITSLVNNAGYITLADIPTFDPSNYDLTEFTNTDSDPFARISDLNSGVTNLAYTPSPTQGTVTSDTGTDAVIPLANSTNSGLLSPSEKSKITTSLQPEDIGVSILAPNGSAQNLTNFPTLNQNTTGSAAKLTTPRTINGTLFDGSQNITTINWGTSRNLSIGDTSKSVNGSGDVAWSTSEIGITKSNIDALGINATQLNGTADYQLTSQKGQPNGYVPLDSGSKIPTIFLPDSLIGQVLFGGTYDGVVISASSNFPELDGEPLPDYADYEGVYLISTEEYTVGTTDFEKGDWIISTGLKWEKVSNTDAVVSFNGRVGVILPNEADYATFYEPIFSKNTAFNKNFGTTAGTVSEGNHTHTFSSLTSKPTTISGYGITDFNSLGDVRWLLQSSYTAADVLTKLLTVDGSGSGLDADLLRGVHWGNVDVDIMSTGNIILGQYAIPDDKSFELRSFNSIFSINLDGDTGASGTTITYTWANGGQGSLKFNSASGEVMRLSPSNNVSIGNTNDIYKLDVTGTGRFTGDLLLENSSGVKYRSQNTVGGYLEMGVTSNATSRGFINFTNGLDVTGGDISASNSIAANSFIKSGGTSSQFLKADGSVDTNSYALSSHTHTFASLTSKPTTISGYGITDFNSLGDARWLRLTGGTLTGTVTATNFILSSDERLKSNIKTIGDIWREFTMNGQKRYGVIAQEVEKIHPEIVHTDDKGYKSVAYMDLLCLKQAENEKLLKEKDDKIEELEERLSKLEKMLL